MATPSQLAAAFGRELDAAKYNSYGKRGDTFLDVKSTGIKLSYKIKNKSDEDRVVYLHPITSLLHLGIDPTNEESVEYLHKFLDSLGLPLTDVLFLPEKQVIVEGTSTVTEQSFEVESTDPNLNIPKLIVLTQNMPILFTSAKFKSKTISGTPEDSNYDNQINLYYISPFYKTEEEAIIFRDGQNANQQSTQFLDVDFLKQGKLALMSPQHAIGLKVNAQTELSVVLNVGSYDSNSERFFRAARDGAKVLRQVENGAVRL
jgi:hypothetical protein